MPTPASQLHQVITVLAQLQVDDPVGDLRRADAGLRALLGTCRGWVEKTRREPAASTRPEAGRTETAGDTFEAAAGANLANRGALERFIVELRAWRLVQGTVDSDDLLAAIADHLAGRAAGTTT